MHVAPDISIFQEGFLIFTEDIDTVEGLPR